MSLTVMLKIVNAALKANAIKCGLEPRGLHDIMVKDAEIVFMAVTLLQ